MDDSLVAFLKAHPAHCEYDEIWPLQPDVPLRVRLCLATVLPPVEVRSSVLGIVARADNRVLFIHPETPSGDIAHLIPGGRPESGETPEETLVREIGEESGWLVNPHGIVGFRHFHHLGPPQLSMADRPYPDFLEPIFAAVAVRYDADLLLPGEKPCEFVDARWAEEVTTPTHRPLLAAALHATETSRPDEGGIL